MFKVRGLMKKAFFSILVSAAILLGGVGMAACDRAPDGHEHIWNEGEVTLEPSCSAEGEKTYACTVSGCKETKTEPIEKTAHAWDNGKVTKEPSCTETGVKTFTCGVCSETRTEPIDKTAHSYDGGTLTVIPTLTGKGEMTFKCGVCGDIKKEAVAARDDFAEHFYTSIADATVWQYGYAEEYDGATGEFLFRRIMQTDEEQPAVWKAEGVAIERNKIYSANNAVIAYPVDGDLQLNITASFTGDGEETCVDAYISVAGADGKIKGEATLISNGQKDWNYTTQEEISVAAGDTLYMLFANSGSGTPGGTFAYRITSNCKHIWNDGEVTKPASCTEAGEKTYTCNLCGDKKTEEIPMTDHDFTGDFAEKDGGHCRTCADCGAEDADNVVSHNFAEDVERRVPATCHSDGVKTMVCPDCGAETTEPITERPAHSLGGWQQTTGGHNKHCQNDGCDYVSATESHRMQDGEIIKPPTATEKGEKESVCQDCGYKEIIELPTTDHTASNVFDWDDDYHWNICGAHLDPACGEKVNKEPHDYKELTAQREEATCNKDGKSYWECECGATKEEIISKDTVPHAMGEGVVTTDPTFWSEGVKTYTCGVCGHTETEAVAKLDSVDFKKDFTTDAQNGDWKYGYAENGFAAHTFEFKEITTNNGGGDGWIDGGAEIKAGWINANKETTIAFNFKADTTVTIKVNVKGVLQDTRVCLRIYAPDAQGNLQEIAFNNGKADNEMQNFTESKDYTFKAGQTVYFMFSNEMWEHPSDTNYPQAEVDITIIRKTESVK